MNYTMDDYNRAEEILGYADAYDLLEALVEGISKHKVVKAMRAAGYDTTLYNALHNKASVLLDKAKMNMDAHR